MKKHILFSLYSLISNSVKVDSYNLLILFHLYKPLIIKTKSICF